MLRRLIAIMAALTLLLSFVPFALAEEPTGYDNIIYSNDFQGVSAGTELNETEMNYRPENCDYAIVQDGENKYYKFSPNSTSTRSNSGNLELGYFLKETIMEKPVQKVKIEMNVAVTMVESGKVAAIAAYNRINADRQNIIEFDQTHFYPKYSSANRVSYNSGEWLYFAIYADFVNNVCSVYVDGELVFEDVQMINSGARRDFTQVRLTIDKGANENNSMCVDNLVYSVTDEEMENIRYTNLNPTITDAKPFDYATELYSENFEGDTEVDSSSLEYNERMTVAVENGDVAAISGKTQGDYVKLTVDGQSSSYFRMKYGTADSPVQSVASLNDLKKTHISFDICPLDNENVNVTLYDKLSSDAEVKENLIVFSDKGYMTFSNKDLKKAYVPNEWISFDIFADFDAKTYTVYLNGNAVVKDVAFKILTGCVEAVGIQTPTAADSYSLYIDNIRMAIREETRVISTYPIKDSSNVSILDDISIKLNNPIKNFLPSMVTVKEGETVCTVTGTPGDDSADCIVIESNGAISIVFPDKMQFDTTYTITLGDTITDCYNEVLGEAYVLTFSTMLPQITYSVPVIGSSVTAIAVNPTATPVNATLVVSVVDSDGAGVIYKDTKTVTSTAPAELEVLYDASSAQPGQKVTAFLCNGENTLKPIRDVFVTTDGQFVSQGTSSVTAEITKAGIIGTIVTIEGKISKSEGQVVIIKITDENNNPVMAVPVVAGAGGEFSYSYSIADMAPGKYFAEITGYYVTQSNKKDYIYLSDAIKNEIKTAINAATSADSVKAVLASYKSKMTLEDGCYNDNVYTVLFEQRPHESYDKLVEMIHKTGSLLAEINGADWTEYTKFFADNSSVVLYGESKLSVYNGYSDNQKNAINQIIVVKNPFADFKELRSEFAIAVNSYTATLENNDDGGGGGSPSKVTSSYEIEPITQENTKNTKNLFQDMSSASWAQESVALLYEKEIVSAAEYYRPYDNVKREEFVKMLVELANIDTEASTVSFKDVNGNEWYAKYLGAAQRAGIINGSDDGSFGVGKPITRQDMVVMALRMVEVTGKGLNQTKEEELFTDNEKISSYAAEAVSRMQRAGVISGMGNGSFEPLATANRAQAAVIICNLIEALV